MYSFPVTVVNASALCNPTGSFPGDLIREITHRSGVVGGESLAVKDSATHWTIFSLSPNEVMKHVPQNLTGFCGKSGCAAERRIKPSSSSHKSRHQLHLFWWMIWTLLTILYLWKHLQSVPSRPISFHCSAERGTDCIRSEGSPRAWCPKTMPETKASPATQGEMGSQKCPPSPEGEPVGFALHSMVPARPGITWRWRRSVAPLGSAGQGYGAKRGLQHTPLCAAPSLRREKHLQGCNKMLFLEKMVWRCHRGWSPSGSCGDWLPGSRSTGQRRMTGCMRAKACRSCSRSPRCDLPVPPVPYFPLMRVILVINLPDPRHWRVAPGTSPSHAAARCPMPWGIHWLPGPRCRDRAATSSRQGWPGCPGARIASQLPHCIRALYLYQCYL